MACCMSCRNASPISWCAAGAQSRHPHLVPRVAPHSNAAWLKNVFCGGTGEVRQATRCCRSPLSGTYPARAPLSSLEGSPGASDWALEGRVVARRGTLILLADQLVRGLGERTWLGLGFGLGVRGQVRASMRRKRGGRT